MKVVHVLKKVETIDNDVKELRKLEKSIAKNKSFSTPIYMTIEKQINILLGDRIKLLDLKIENPPEYFLSKIEEDKVEGTKISIPEIPDTKKKATKEKAKSSAPDKSKVDILNDDEIPMLTQDLIDTKFDELKNEKTESATEPKEINSDIKKDEKTRPESKLLDVALEQSSINRKVVEKEKKVKFFRENFPSD